MVKYSCERCRMTFDTIEEAQNCEQRHSVNDVGLAPVEYIGQVLKSAENPEFKYVTIGKVPIHLWENSFDIPLLLHLDVDVDNNSKCFFFYERPNAVVQKEEDPEQQLIAVRRSIYGIEYLLDFIDINALYYTKELLEKKCQDLYKEAKYGNR